MAVGSITILEGRPTRLREVESPPAVKSDDELTRLTPGRCYIAQGGAVRRAFDPRSERRDAA